LFNVAFSCEVKDPNGDPEKNTETFLVLRPTWSIDEAERSKLREDAKKRIQDIQQAQQGAKP